MRYYFKIQTEDIKEYPIMIIDHTHDINVLTSIIVNEALEMGIIDSRLEPLEFKRISKKEFDRLTNYRFFEVASEHMIIAEECIKQIQFFINTQQPLYLDQAKKLIDQVFNNSNN